MSFEKSPAKKSLSTDKMPFGGGEVRSSGQSWTLGGGAGGLGPLDKDMSAFFHLFPQRAAGGFLDILKSVYSMKSVSEHHFSCVMLNISKKISPAALLLFI